MFPMSFQWVHVKNFNDMCLLQIPNDTHEMNIINVIINKSIFKKNNVGSFLGVIIAIHLPMTKEQVLPKKN
jgi:hypothetical protein